jgi:L-cystine uptake protein TcyP (sodium:dicarboxylate symporter family)
MGAAEIEGIIIGVIVLARVIVALTPTKKDDEYLSQHIPTGLKLLSIVFGLDLRQGREKYDKNKETKK